MKQTASTSDARFQSPDVRRRQILDAAARLAVEEGLETTSIANVAAAAGLSKGSIYLHFESRKALLTALQADLWTQMLQRPEQIEPDPGLTAIAKLDAIIEHLMRFEYEHHDLYHAVFHTVATDDGEPFTQAASLLRRLLLAGIADGEFELDGFDVDIVLQFVLHGYTGPCFHHEDPDLAITNVQRLFHRIVAPETRT